MADESEPHRWTEEELLAGLQSDHEAEEVQFAAMEAEMMKAADLPPAGVCEAAGAIVIGQNGLELALFELLHFFLILPTEVVANMFAALNNRARADLISRLADTEHVKSGDDERDAVSFMIRCFDICTENRNVIAHSGFIEARGERSVFRKFATAPGASGWSFAVTEEELRSVASETAEISLYVVRLWGAMRRRLLADPLTPLPERPPQPRKLNLFRLPEDQKGDEPPLQS